MADDGTAQGSGSRFSVLVVCTGNICRSPLAEILLRHQLVGRLGGRAADRFTVSSAGTLAAPGAGMHPLTRAELSPWGLYPRGGRFTARRLTPDMSRSADLVLTASPQHRAQVLTDAPEALDRTFALLRFARLAGVVDRYSLPDPPVDRARALVRAVRTADSIGPVPKDLDTVPDPVQGDPDLHHTAAMLVARAVVEICDALAPLGGRPHG